MLQNVLIYGLYTCQTKCGKQKCFTYICVKYVCENCKLTLNTKEFGIVNRCGKIGSGLLIINGLLCYIFFFVFSDFSDKFAELSHLF